MADKVFLDSCTILFLTDEDDTFHGELDKLAGNKSTDVVVKQNTKEDYGSDEDDSNGEND